MSAISSNMLVGLAIFLPLALAAFLARSATSRLAMLAAAAIAIGIGMKNGFSADLAGPILLAISCIAALAVRLFGSSSPTLSDEEQRLREALMTSLGGKEARRLLDQGRWLNAKAGEVLIEQGQPVSHLFFVGRGQLDVLFAGRHVTSCGPGKLVGEATVLSGGHATASVRVAEASRLWTIEAEPLRSFLSDHPDTRSAIERQINDALQAKLRAANEQIAGRDS